MAEIIEFFRRQDSSQVQPAPDSSSSHTFLLLIQNPFQSAFQANAFWVSLGTSISITIALALLFSVARPYHSLVYAPKIKYADDKHALPPIGRGLFAWFSPVLKTREAQLVDKIGLDATIFLRFTKMCRNIFLILSIIGCVIMIPVNVAQGNKVISKGQSAFAIMSPLYIFGNALWSHVVCAWAFDIIVAYFLWHNYRAVRRLRRQYFASHEYQQSMHARTLMVTDVPPNFRTDEGLLRITDEVNPTNVLPRAAIGRNVKELPKLIEQYEKAVRDLESVLSKYLKNPDRLPANRPMCRPQRMFPGHRPGAKVDAIDYLANRIRELEMEIKDMRETLDKRNAMPYGFASWDHIEEAHSVAFAAKKKHPQQTTIQLAPRPNDIIWDNLPLTPKVRKWKKLTNIFWVAVLTVIWIAPNALIAIFLSDLSNLGHVWPAFQTSLEQHRKIWAAVQGIASPAILSTVYLLLPTIFRRLAIRSGDLTKTARERHVVHQLYAFFVFNNLVVFSIFSAVWAFVTAVINAKNSNHNVWDSIKEGEFFIKIMIALCQISPFWVTWVLQRNLGAAIDIAQLWTLFWVWFARTFLSPTPRQYIEWTAPPPFDYAMYYNYWLFYSTVALCFATLQPIILPVTALYFTLDAWLKKYLLMYVFTTKHESGGQFWRILFNRVIFAMLFANVCIGLVVKARGTWYMIGALAPLPLLLLGFKWYCVRTFDDDIQFYTRTMNDSEAIASKKLKTQRVSAKFGHPALWKSLITPMVHARAQHVLGQVYRGRIGSETAPSTMGYSDIAMESMERDQPGKPADSAPFEIVPEGQMDFAYYKNRSDFRDEFGGGLYGKPEDLISERSQTPVSFAGMPTPGGYRSPSPSSSRDTSPDRVTTSPKQFEDSAYPDIHSHPAFRGDRRAPSTGAGDIASARPLYTNPNESEGGLLSGAQDMPTSEPGILGMDRWRTGGTGYGPVEQQEEDPVSYDYYKAHRDV